MKSSIVSVSTSPFARRILAVLASVALATGIAGGNTASDRQPTVPEAIGNYPNQSMPLSSSTTIAPDAAPTSTTSMSVLVQNLFTFASPFRGRIEANPNSGVVRITNAHPAGTYTVTVKALNTGVVNATRTFTLVVTTPTGCAPVNFAPAVNYAVGNIPFGLAVTDYTRNGRQDLIVTNSDSDTVSFLMNNGAGIFTAGDTLPASDGPLAVAVMDYNGDGKQDYAVANFNASAVNFIAGSGGGDRPQEFVSRPIEPNRMSPVPEAPEGFTGPTALAAGDFNTDGREDFAVTGFFSNNVRVFLRNPVSGFTQGVIFSTGTNPVAVAMGDFNQDGAQDLVIANEASHNVSIFFGNGAGGFSEAPGSPIAVGTTPSAVVVGDFNGDSQEDLAVTNFNSNNVSILIGNGVGNFTNAANSPFATGNRPAALAVGDFNGDRRQDLAVSNAVSNSVSILLGGGNSQFAAPLNFPVGAAPRGIVVGDFNRDGQQDIAVANRDSNTVSVLLRTCAAATLGNYPAILQTALSRNANILPDAAPTNATGMRVSTSTSFKGNLEGDPVTGAIRVTDAHPAGTYQVTVEALNGTIVSATRTIFLTVTTPATTCGAVGFAPSNFGVMIEPWGVAVGDFNRDGHQDLAVPDRGQSLIGIFLGDGAGNFTRAINSPNTGDSPTGIAVGDFNGDGRQDLVAANAFSNNISVVLGGSSPASFSGPTYYTTGLAPQSVAVGDFNGDSKPDLAVANRGSNTASIFLGDGAGTFGGPTSFPTGSEPFTVAIGDFNADGKQDLAVTNSGLTNVSILLGDGAGSFNPAPGSPFAAGFSPAGLAVGDFNADGKQDLAVSNVGSNNVSILLGAGTGSFGSPMNFNVGLTPLTIAVGDFNGDGTQDVATANFSSNDVSILFGTGTGGFSAATNFSAGGSLAGLAVGDFALDGKQDLAMANQTAGSLSVLNRICAPAVVSAVSRKNHGGNNFDVLLPLTGDGIESRAGGTTNDYTIVVSFSDSVAVSGSPQAEVIAGTGTIGSGGVANGGAVTASGGTITIPLTNVTSEQIIQVRLNNVTGGSSVTIPMGVLVGDTNANGSVSASDIGLTKSQSGQAVTVSNFRADVNANGQITASDIGLVKSKSGAFIP